MGERPSKTALERGWRWKHGRLAAKQLFDGLTAISIDPSSQHYMNLFRESLSTEHILIPGVLTKIKKLSKTMIVVAIGKKVAVILSKTNIAHLAIVPPAVRGKIRKKDHYREHLRKILLSSC